MGLGNRGYKLLPKSPRAVGGTRGTGSPAHATTRKAGKRPAHLNKQGFFVQKINAKRRSPAFQRQAVRPLSVGHMVGGELPVADKFSTNRRKAAQAVGSPAACGAVFGFDRSFTNFNEPALVVQPPR